MNGEIRAQRLGYQGRERLLVLNGMVLDLPDEIHRQVDVELFDFCTHASMLACAKSPNQA